MVKHDAQVYQSWQEVDPPEREAEPPQSVAIEVQECWSLAYLLDDFPLALVQASEAIRLLELSIGEYCTLYNDEYARLQEEDNVLPNQNKDSHPTHPRIEETASSVDTPKAVLYGTRSCHFPYKSPCFQRMATVARCMRP